MKVLVTGGSSGIGSFLIGHLLQKGHYVWSVARRDQYRWREQFADTFVSSSCDVSQWETIEQVAQDVRNTWKDLDGLIACAGTQGGIGPSMELSPQDWMHTVHTNLNGTYFAVRAFYPLLARSERRAKVMLFSGGGATGARPYFSAYAAAKTAIVRLTEILAKEWQTDPIDINAIAPGAIHTAMTEELISLGPDRIGLKEYETAVSVKNGGGGSLQKISALADYLLSENSDGVSGRLIAAQWDDWEHFNPNSMGSNFLTLRRMT